MLKIIKFKIQPVRKEISMPVTMMNSGVPAKIVRISGTDAVRRHLTDMGFVAGDEVTVISNNNGNLIIQVKNSRVAMDAAMAKRILVA